MTRKFRISLFLFVAIMSLVLPVFAETPGGTTISTVVPHKYTITVHMDGDGSIKYENVLYKNGETIQVLEGTDMNLVFYPDSQYKLKQVLYQGENITKQVSDGAIVLKNVQKDGTLEVTYTKIPSILVPATGDHSNLSLGVILILGSIGALAVIGLQTKKSKSS